MKNDIPKDMSDMIEEAMKSGKPKGMSVTTIKKSSGPKVVEEDEGSPEEEASESPDEEASEDKEELSETAEALKDMKAAMDSGDFEAAAGIFETAVQNACAPYMK